MNCTTSPAAVRDAYQHRIRKPRDNPDYPSIHIIAVAVVVGSALVTICAGVLATTKRRRPSSGAIYLDVAAIAVLLARARY